MKQIFIAGNVAYPTGVISEFANTTKCPVGSVGVYNLADGSLVDGDAVADDFSVALFRGANKQPWIMDEVDFHSLKVVKSTAVAATTYTSKLTIASSVEGKDYTVIVVKKGKGFNERANWSFTVRAKDNTAANVATALAAQVNANPGCGVTASVASAAITFTATEAGLDYEIVPADMLTGVALTNVTAGKPSVNYAKDIEALAKACAANKGFEYTAEDAHELYPGYPESAPATSYVLYTLRFAVHRKSAKTRDEVVSQLLHIAVPTTATSMISDLDTIFGLDED